MMDAGIGWVIEMLAALLMSFGRDYSLTRADLMRLVD